MTEPWSGVFCRWEAGLGSSRVPSSSWFCGSTSFCNSPAQRVPALSHPTHSHAGGRGRLLLNVLFLAESSWEGGGEPEVCGQPAWDWVDWFALHSSSHTSPCPRLPRGLPGSVPGAAGGGVPRKSTSLKINILFHAGVNVFCIKQRLFHLNRTTSSMPSCFS